jgi:hypothetical protein
MVGGAGDIAALQQAWRESQPGEAVVASPRRALDELENFIFDTQVSQPVRIYMTSAAPRLPAAHALDTRLRYGLSLDMPR